MGIILSLIIGTIAVFATAYILPGARVESLLAAFVTAIVFGVVNTFLKPVINILALPINLLTLGLFSLVINALLVLLVAYLVPGFSVDGFLWAIIFSLVISLVNTFLSFLL